MMDESDLSPADQRTARVRAYSLLSTLWLDGLTSDVRPLVAALSGLREVMPQGTSDDEAAADHHGLLGLTVFPYASYFLNTDGQIGGNERTKLATLYAGHGYQPPVRHAPDHLGVILAALADWTQGEIDADPIWRNQARVYVRQAQFDCLHHHVVPWIQPFLLAVEMAGSDFYATLAGLTRQIVTDHVLALDGVTRRVAFPQLATPLSAPDPTATQTTLAELATYLTVPARSGVFLSRQDLQAMGRALELPGGFGNRRQILVNMLRMGATYDLLGALLVELRRFVAVWRTRYLACAQRAPATHNAMLSEPWLPRVEETLHLLETAAELADTTLAQGTDSQSS